MSNLQPHVSNLSNNPDIESKIKEKILYFNEQDESPAVQFLLSNIKLNQTRKTSLSRPSKLRQQLPKLTDLKYHQKSLTTSVRSTPHNTNDTSIQPDTPSFLQSQFNNIRSEIMSSRFNLNVAYLEEIESQPKIDTKNKKKSYFSTQLTKRSTEIAPGSISHRNSPILFTQIQSSVKEYFLMKKRVAKDFQSEKLADFNTLRPLCNVEDMLLLNHFETQQHIFMQALRHRNHELIIKLFADVLEICQDINKLLVFSQSVFYLGCLCLDCEQIDKAIFFLQQTLIICEYTRDHQLKIRVLQQLASCASKFQMYQQAIDLLKKSLIYAWATNDFEQEVQSYDMLGLNYFYKGDLKQAIQLHEKYTLGELEPQGGYFRKTSKQFIFFYEQQLQFFSETLNQQFMTKLSLPIMNKFEIGLDKPNPTCDQFKVNRYDTCNGISIIDKIVVGIEYTQYSLEYYQTQTKVRNTHIPNQKASTKDYLPIEIIRIQQKNSDYKDKYSFSHKFSSNELYNIPLGVKVQARIEKAHELDTIWRQVQRSVSSNHPALGGRQEQIFMKHLAETRCKKEDISIFLRRNKESINKIIVSIAVIKN